MDLLSYLYPRTVEELPSPVNGKIKVIKFWGNYRIHVGGLSQSGGLVNTLWDTALKKIHNSSFIIHNSLVLGVGGGTVIKSLNKYFPNAKITAIEIDPLMIKLAKKYFNLDHSKNLRIIIQDAINWVLKNKQKKFDLILVDLYIGKDIPRELESDYFLKALKRILNKKGITIINRLRDKENQKEIDEFIEKLRKNFNFVKMIKPLVNYLIFCSKE